MAIQSINPATGEVLASFDPLTAEELDARLARAAGAFASYRHTSFEERAGWLRAAADLLDADQLDPPPGVVSVLPGGREVGEQLVGHPGVDRVAFTGSTQAGRQVAAACGTSLKRLSLELGGKSAAIVLDDAEREVVAQGVRIAGLMNGGQACVAQTRVLVPRFLKDEFVDALAAQRQQSRVRGYIDAGQRESAKLVVGGTGSFGVNEAYSMDPAAPFGGTKASGLGRELGREGLEGYLEVKAISVAAPPG